MCSKETFERILLGTVLMLALSGLSGVQAFVLPGPQVLALMQKALGRFGTLQVVQQRQDQPLAAAMTAARPVTEILRYRSPDAVRVDVHDPAGHRVFLLAGGALKAATAEADIASRELCFWRYQTLFLTRGRKLLSSRLQRLGVDVRTTRLDRFEGRIAVVLGAPAADAPADELWIDKETWRPLRWVIHHQGERLEIRLQAWQKYGDLWYPRRIRFLADDTLVRESAIQRVAVEPGLAARWFDPANLQAEPEPPRAPP